MEVHTGGPHGRGHHRPPISHPGRSMHRSLVSMHACPHATGGALPSHGPGRRLALGHLDGCDVGVPGEHTHCVGLLYDVIDLPLLAILLVKHLPTSWSLRHLPPNTSEPRAPLATSVSEPGPSSSLVIPARVSPAGSGSRPSQQTWHHHLLCTSRQWRTCLCGNM